MATNITEARLITHKMIMIMSFIKCLLLEWEVYKLYYKIIKLKKNITDNKKEVKRKSTNGMIKDEWYDKKIMI